MRFMAMLGLDLDVSLGEVRGVLGGSLIVLRWNPITNIVQLSDGMTFDAQTISDFKLTAQEFWNNREDDRLFEALKEIASSNDPVATARALKVGFL